MSLKPLRAVKATEYFNGSRLKALGDGKIGGYLVVFGGPKDAQGEWFRPDCNFHFDWYSGATRPILYHHGLRDQDIIEEIGKITQITKDGHGVYAVGQLDMSNPRSQQVYNDVRKGKIGWSSGSAPHLSKVDEDDGGISEWAILEGSLTPTPAAGKRTSVQALKFDFTSTPNNKTSTAIGPGTVKGRHAKRLQGERRLRQQTIKGNEEMSDLAMIAALEKAGIGNDQIVQVLKELATSENEPDGDETEMMDDASVVPPDTATMAAPDDEAEGKSTNFVEDGDGGAEIEDTGSKPAMIPPAQSPAPAPGSKAAKMIAKSAGNDAKALATAIQIAMATMKTAPAKSKAPGYQGDNPARIKTRITDVHTPYHDLTSADMAFLYEMRRQGKNPRYMGLEFEREMATKAMTEYKAGGLKLASDTARKVAMKLDFNNTTSGSDGANWVPDLWSSILWMRTRIDNNVAKNIEVFQMPSPTFEYPIESTDPVVYAVGESDTDAEQTLATNVFTRSKLVVSKMQFSAKKTGLQVGFSTEIEEDSIIPFIPQLRAQATRAFANSIDFNLLNSDSTTGTGNINYKGANTSAAPASNFLFGGGNGMRYNAIISNTGVLQSFAGGKPTLQGIRTLRSKLISATQSYGMNPEDLVIICEPQTYFTFLGIDEINVFMNNGRNATVNTGMVPNIDLTPVFPSYELKLADSDGYVESNGSSTLGNFVIFAKNAWKVGYVRQVMTDVSYVPWNDSYILTMTARYAIGKKDTIGSALGYNINTN